MKQKDEGDWNSPNIIQSDPDTRTNASISFSLSPRCPVQERLRNAAATAASRRQSGRLRREGRRGVRAVWVRRWESGARWGEMLAYCLLAIVGDVRRNGRGPWTGAMDGRKREDTPADMAGFLGRTEGSTPRLPGMKGLYLHAYALSMLHMSMWRYI